MYPNLSYSWLLPGAVQFGEPRQDKIDKSKTDSKSTLVIATMHFTFLAQLSMKKRLDKKKS